MRGINAWQEAENGKLLRTVAMQHGPITCSVTMEGRVFLDAFLGIAQRARAHSPTARNLVMAVNTRNAMYVVYTECC